jgi:hypothetical protein
MSATEIASTSTQTASERGKAMTMTNSGVAAAEMSKRRGKNSREKKTYITPNPRKDKRTIDQLI